MKGKSFGRYNRRRIKFSIHPLFVVLGVYYSAVGKLVEFILCSLTAVIHELGHGIVAERSGYALNDITLMPFGAVVNGDIDGLKPKDEILIAIAGPLTNFAVGLFFVALWWLYPIVYVYTDLIVALNFSVAIVNLIPSYPLDGGRVLCSLLTIKCGKERARFICKLLGVILSCVLIVAFIITLKSAVNVSLIFFAVFTLFGALRKKENNFIKIYNGVTSQRLKRGVTIKRIAIDEGVTLKKLMSALDETAINEVVVYSGYKPIKTLYEDDLKNLIESGSIYQKIGNFL